MAIIVEGILNGKKVSYDLVMFHNVLMETLVKKHILTQEEMELLYRKSV